MQRDVRVETRVRTSTPLWTAPTEQELRDRLAVQRFQDEQGRWPGVGDGAAHEASVRVQRANLTRQAETGQLESETVEHAVWRQRTAREELARLGPAAGVVVSNKPLIARTAPRARGFGSRRRAVSRSSHAGPRRRSADNDDDPADVVGA